MMKKLLLISIITLLLFAACKKAENSYTGSRSCKECHENFYQLWESSYHGSAMQNFTVDFAKNHLTACDTSITVNKEIFRYQLKKRRGIIIEEISGKRYRISHVLGGKYVYYFLTPLDKGKLQTLPLGYDVEKKEWFDITSSAIRSHQSVSDAALPWTDRRYTFNTSCYSCHVSQLSSEYDIQNDSYHTTWLEAGINCETCHGPAEEHKRQFTQAKIRDEIPEKMHLKTITQSRGYSADQVNAMCSYCHAKMISLTPVFVPGKDFYQHFDLITYENPDFYPDGRDLGENYTYTGWLMSPCVENSDMDCLHCHTSSGRYRQKDDPNASCLPCHADRVQTATDHTHHPEGSAGNECIACHMPKTEFARMTRSDHSMRPPMPAATRAYGSPNACNACHTDKTPAWADSVITQRYTGRFQAETLQWAKYLNALRKGDKNQLNATLTFLASPQNEIIKSAMIRSLDNIRDERVISILLTSLHDPSALVRSSAATALLPYLNPLVIEQLSMATRDSVRLVRIRAAASLASLSSFQLPELYREDIASAMGEYHQSLLLFPDSEISHYNLGHFHEQRNQHSAAITSYRRSLSLRPEQTESAVNLAMLYYQNGNIDSSLFYLLHAAAENPTHPLPHLNLGLLYAELGYADQAIESFETSFQLENNAVAAYNLAVLYSATEPDHSINRAKQAYELQPENSKYLYTYAFYLLQNGESKAAEILLESAIQGNIVSFDIYYLLGSIYKNSSETTKFQSLYKNASGDMDLSENEREFFRNK